MTLWAIARSPLIMGGDLRHLDDATLKLLTNPDVIAVNQHSTDNQPHFELDGTRIWSARAPDGRHYLALFNTGKAAKAVPFRLERLGLDRVTVRDLWSGADLGTATGSVSVTLPPHGAALLQLTA